MPRRLASSYTSSGRVAHSGRPSDRWTPSLESCDAGEWTCRSALLVWSVIGAPSFLFLGWLDCRFPCKRALLVNKEQPSCDLVVKWRRFAGRAENDAQMEPGAPPIPGDAVVLRLGALSIEVQLRPFSFTVRRA